MNNKINFKLLDKAKKYMIGVSGGPDSMFLLDNVFNYFGCGNNIVVAHVNYNSRESSLRDYKIVKKYCEEKNIKFIYLNWYRGKDESNFEKTAREVRYNFFKLNYKKNNCNAILIAHNFTDKIETYIIQKERNIVPDHYGLKEINWILNTKILRIILNVSRESIIDYLYTNKIIFGIDETNADLKYLRNRIRTNFKKYNVEKLIEEINYKNNLLLIINNHIKKFKYVDINFYLKLDFNFQQQCIKKLLSINKIFVWNKKGKFLYEITKQTLSKQSNIKININNDFFLCKEKDKIILLENIKIKKINIEWYDHLSYLLTNDQKIYSKYNIGNKNLKELLNRNNLSLELINIPVLFVNKKIVWISKQIINCLNEYDKKRILKEIKINYQKVFNLEKIC